MNTFMKNSLLAFFLIFATTLSVSAQIKPSKQKKTTTTEQTDNPSDSDNTDTNTNPSTTSKKKTTTKKTDQYFDESGGFKHRLWYGGNFNLNFAGDGQSYSQFTLGLTPMIGYKIVGGLSAGPRVGFNYTKVKFINNGQTVGVNLWDYNLGAFARYKVFKNFFVHTEGDYYNAQIPGSETSPGQLITDVDGKPFTFRYGATSYYGGVGYNSGGIIGYEIMALYNFSLPKSSLQSALELRFGFTYNF